MDDPDGEGARAFGARLQGLMRALGGWLFLMGFVGIGLGSNCRKVTTNHEHCGIRLWRC